MDPVASAITIVSSALTLTITVTKIISEIRHRDENVQELENKSDILGAIIHEVQVTYNIREERRATLATAPPDENEVRVLSTVKRIVECCKNDLEKYRRKLSKLVEARDRKNLLLQAWREQVAGPTLKKIADSIDRHHGSLNLLVNLHQGHVLDARFAAILESQIQVLEGINEIKATLNVQSNPLIRNTSGEASVNNSQVIEYEDLNESSDEEETFIQDEKLLERPRSPGQSSENGKSLLQAVKEGRIDVLENLIGGSDTDIEQTDEQGRTALVLAANLGKADMMNILLTSHSININATDDLGRTALHYCAQMKMNKSMNTLLDRKADANIQDRGDHPPLYYAIGDANSYDTIKMLLEHNATIDFELPSKVIPKSVHDLFDRYNNTGCRDPVTGPTSTQPTKTRTKSLDGQSGGRKSSILRPWKSTGK